jgi:hypothetical protein
MENPELRRFVEEIAEAATIQYCYGSAKNQEEVKTTEFEAGLKLETEEVYLEMLYPLERIFSPHPEYSEAVAEYWVVFELDLCGESEEMNEVVEYAR